MRCKGAIDKYQVFIIPTFGWINLRWYYGYPVIGIGFAWLIFRFKVEFGVKKVRTDNGSNI